ncbi:asparagine synthase (glutamine-hydrolyzing) [Stutzerimonas stutzeri]|uniref:asparagine synthase (glutamine-hydrolyzing) n=1 Tax=Stutzerimonas stutzeri TaxID=316 RepID=UPI003C2BCFC5
MCGIFGLTNFNSIESSLAKEALNALSHRGPDGYGEYCDDSVYIGHRRLSILDLSDHGKQPMLNFSKDIVIAVNGEIYNFKSLREELEINHIFISESDSEVVLHGYVEWGIEGLISRLDGMYAISIYDKQKEKLYLIRDRVGIKPLYYGVVSGRLSWASELKSLKIFFGETLSTDYTACYDYLTYLYIPAPKTLYKDVYKLEPGHYLDVNVASGKFVKRRYWLLETRECSESPVTAKRKVYELLEKSVKEQLVADVPIGFFLSGGIDSSAVVAIAAKIHSDVNAYTIGFEDKAHDETEYAKLAACHFDINHNIKVLSHGEIDKLFENIHHWYDEPFADTSCFPTYMVSKEARRNSVVALTGDGGDEVFGGYRWYKKFKFIRGLSFLGFLRLLNPILNRNSKTKKIAANVELFFLDDLELYTKLLGGMLKSEKEAYRIKWNIPEDYDDYWNFRQFYRPDLSPVKRLQYLDFHTYLPDDILTKVDRASMAVSLECRVPFLSKDIVEYLFSLPESVTLPNGELKGLMKQALEELLPVEILKRAKRGFSIPRRKVKTKKDGGLLMKQEEIGVKFFNF